MTNTTFTKWSNWVKIIAAIIGCIVAGLTQVNTGIAKSSLMIIGSIAVVAFVILTVFDKLYNDVTIKMELFFNKLNELQDNLKLNFEYHGLLDSRKADFDAAEMREIWTLLIERVKNDFIAVNYLSHHEWCQIRGDDNAVFLGSKMKLTGRMTKRLFIVDSIAELSLWAKTFKDHQNVDIAIKYMLKDEFNKHKQAYTKSNPRFADTVGFNVIDSDNPGVVVDWKYDTSRGTNGARLLRGTEPAKEYTAFFGKLWDNAVATA